MTAYKILDWRDQAAGSIEEIVTAFLGLGEAIATRWIETRKGVLLLQMVPDDGASGAIYVFDRQHEQWYMLSFEECDPVHLGEVRPCVLRIRPVPFGRTARPAALPATDRQRLT